MSTAKVELSAVVDATAVLENGVRVWDNAQIRDNAYLGENVIVGKGAYIGSKVKVGKNSKIQNYALVYEPAILHNGVFIGPGTVLTNDHNPRAINSDGSQKKSSDWEASGVEIEEGASIGAGSVCVAPVKIGKWASIAAGSVVTNDVPPFALMIGVPARQVGWVGHAGARLKEISENIFLCPITEKVYRLTERTFEEVKK